ncbi:MAG: hypothetical protein JNJ86_12610 [Chitinophagaceae bacterium]|jgi:hypothetical protein|nr:hypothetical protein [Chitinophagaceae bacterium]
MAEEKFSPEQSLQLIQSMISKTKQNMSDNSIYFLIWGWLTFIAFIGQFILKHILQYEKHYMVWLVVIIGIIFSIYQGKKDEKKVRAKTWVGENMSHLWAGMAISFFVLSMIITRMGWGTVVYPFFIMLYGLGTFVSGNFLRFRPLIIGGIIAWILAVASTWVSYDYQMLFAAAAILFSYIIPAYMLRRRDKINNQ